MKLALLTFVALACLGCAMAPQRGGTSTATLGGSSRPTVVTTEAPQNPQTPTTTTVEKTTTRDYEFPRTTEATDDSQGDSAREQPETSPRSAAAQSESRVAAVAVQGASPATNRQPGAAAPVKLLRETVTERATTQTGVAQKDNTRDLTARLANMRGVMWVGVLLLIGGPVVGAKMGWFTNGCIAGGVGLLLIILSTVIPGNEAWFGLGGLLLIPLVGFVYYKSHHDATSQTPPSA